MSDTFTPGDVVRLKSGGPAMTIGAEPTKRGELQVVGCVWFTADGHELKAENFPVAVLTRTRV